MVFTLLEFAFVYKTHILEMLYDSPGSKSGSEGSWTCQGVQDAGSAGFAVDRDTIRNKVKFLNSEA